VVALASTPESKVVALFGPKPQNTFLVGHSLENDLKALRLPHERCIDTALLYPLRVNVQGPPSKSSLRALTARYLQRAIQQSDAGHDPGEDAVAAMELCLLKLRNGPSFGVPGASWGDGFCCLHTALKKAGWACSSIDREEELQLLHGAASDTLRQPCRDDEEAVGSALRHAQREKGVVWLTLRGLLEASEQGRAAASAATGAVRGQLEQLPSQLPANTLLLVLGTGTLAASSLDLMLQADGSRRSPGCVSMAIAGGPHANGAAGVS